MFTFLGIGAQKAGTTWLYTMLAQHPAVNFPGGKELHYWNRRFPNSKLSVDSYLRQFDHPTTQQGEITPAYGHLPVSTIGQIYQCAPNLRVIYIMRNPIDRAWSSALMALKRAEMTIDEASDNWFVDHFRSRGSLERGDYERCLRNWRKFYPEEQLLLLYYDDLVADPVAVIDCCCTYLQIKPFGLVEKEALQPHTRIFSGNGNTLRPTLKATLTELYKPKISSLSSYLGKKLDHWVK